MPSISRVPLPAHCTSDIAKRDKFFSLIVAITFISFMLNFVGLPMLLTFQHPIFVVSIFIFTKDLVWFCTGTLSAIRSDFFVFNAF